MRYRASRLRPLAALLLLVALTACRQGEEAPAPAPPSDPLAGTWRATLASPGGELPFVLRIERLGDRLRAVAVNGEEQARFSSVESAGSRVTLRMDWYDSEITAEVDATGDRMAGRWRRTGSKGASEMPFAATRAEGDAVPARFRPPAEAGLEPGDPAAVPDVAGAWTVELRDEEGASPAQAELRQEGKRVTGTFLTPTGDHRYLEGTYEDGLLRLSTFDGSHAFLYHARARADGTLAGDFWSRDSYHATWFARRVAAGEQVLPDAWQEVGLTSRDGRLHFRFADLKGNPVAPDDPAYAGKVLLVNLFGTWCPNCNDEAPLLARWHRRYGDQGFEVIGLAYEMTGDPERDKEFVARFARRYAIEYPLLLAGTSDKKAAGKTLPDLSAVAAFPTTIFLGRDGKVRKIHTGFAGPGTGEHHEKLVAEMEGLILKLLAEPDPTAG